MHACEKRARALLVWLSQQTLQTQQHRLYIVHGAPLIAENVQTDPSGEVDIGMINRCLEQDRRRRVRIVIGKVKGELHNQSIVGGFRRPRYCRRPEEKITVRVRKGGNAGRGGQHELHQFGLEATCISG